MTEPNDYLRAARERTQSPSASGEPMTRQELAELVNAWVYDNTEGHRVIDLDANYVGKLERGDIHWMHDADRRKAFRAVLNVETDQELGFRRPRRSRSTVVSVDRHQFLRATLGAGAAAAVGQSFAGLIGPTQPTPIPSVVGLAEVAEIRTAARVFENWDALYGAGLVREAVAAQLRYSAELLNARCTERVRSELFSAVGFLGHTAGFMAFDAYAHDDARRMFRFALACAEEATSQEIIARYAAAHTPNNHPENDHQTRRVITQPANLDSRCGN